MNNLAGSGHRHSKFRVDMGYKIEDIERLIFLASMAISDHDDELNIRMFIECQAAFDQNIGELHVLDVNNMHTAFCFVLDKFEGEKGAKHLHLVSVVKNARNKGAGRLLMDYVMHDIGVGPVTLESNPSSYKFFEKMGFLTKPAPLDRGYLSMFANSDGSHYQFYNVLDFYKGADIYYFERFKRVADSFEFG